jgi:hypothetical protein
MDAYRLNQVCLASGVEPLRAQQHHRGAPAASQCQVHVEIVVQCHADPFVAPRPVQDFEIFGLLHPDLGHMNGVYTALAK